MNGVVNFNRAPSRGRKMRCPEFPKHKEVDTFHVLDFLIYSFFYSFFAKIS